MDVRLAREEDEAFLAGLFEEIHAAELIPAALPEAMVAQLLSMQYRGQTMSYRAQFPDGESSIVWLGGERIGRLWVNESERELRVVDIALSGVYQGRGFGRRLLEDLGRRAQEKGIPMRLSVRPGSAAVRLYERMGFVAVSSTNTHAEMEWTGHGRGAVSEPEGAAEAVGFTDETPRLEATYAGFRSLVGREVVAELGGGAWVKLRVSEVSLLETKQPDVVANDSFVVAFEGPAEVVLATTTHTLTYGEAEAATSLEVFLSALGRRGEAMQYEAIFNRMTPVEAAS